MKFKIDNNQIKNRKWHLSTTQVIALGFLAVILVGAGLLMLPISSRAPGGQDFFSCLFTATSATCVTGLVVTDTYLNWTLFGQIVILFLIQIGGLGFMTFGVFFSILIGRNIGLKERNLMQESVNSMQIGGVVRLVRKIVVGTALFEGIGAVILTIRFSRDMPLLKAVYYGIFHSVSAFCNGGFDLMGYQESYSSLVSYAGDITINLVIMLLITIGGIGFLVWDDIQKNKWHFGSYMLHTKLVLTVSAVLTFGGALCFYLTERTGVLSGMGIKDTVLASLFSSVTARTAGFNTVDTGALTPASKLLTIVLMFIGGSPGSTAGGIKTTTMIVMLLVVWANLRNTKGTNVFGRRLNEDAIRKASIVFTINLGMAVISAIVMMTLQPFAMEDILFEVFSAIGTVGMSAGITRDLCGISKAILILLMYCGRIGSLTFALSFVERRKADPLMRPEEKILIG